MTATRGAIAGDALTRALLELAAKRMRPHCSDPELHSYWLSESDAERSIAVSDLPLLCSGCCTSSRDYLHSDEKSKIRTVSTPLALMVT
jgi:hypothetical protein